MRQDRLHIEAYRLGGPCRRANQTYVEQAAKWNKLELPPPGSHDPPLVGNRWSQTSVSPVSLMFGL